MTFGCFWFGHLWREVGRTLTPRLSKLDGLKCSEYLAERLMCGVTVIRLRCERCGDTKGVEFLGQHVDYEARQ